MKDLIGLLEMRIGRKILVNFGVYSYREIGDFKLLQLYLAGKKK